MVEQQSRDEPGAALARQELECGQHLPVVGAGERREQGFEGAQVERRKRGWLEQRALAHGGAEHVQVVRPQAQRDARARHAGHGDGNRDRRAATARCERGQDEDRRQRLPAARSEHVDRGLGRGPVRLGHRHEQELDPEPVERRSQRAVGDLEQQGAHESGARGHAERAQQHEQGQHGQRPAHAQRAHQPA